SFAKARLDGVDDGRAFFITDGVNVDLRTTTALTAIPVGGAGSRENVAVTALGARRHPLDPSRLEAMVTLWNSGTRPRKVALTLVGDGRVVDTASMQLSPGERTTRVLPNLVAERELEARIEATDGIQDTLRADDIAYASVPRRRPIRVLAVTHGNLYLEAALLLDGTIELETASPADIPSTAAFDAVIFDRVSPPAPSTTPALYIASPEETTGANFPLSPQGEVPRPRFDRTLRDHPLLAWLRLGDVNVARAALLKPDAADTVVAGDARGALLVTGTRNGAPFVTLAFDVRESDLPLRVAWPVLMLNAVDYLTERTVEELPTVHTGERVRVPASTGEATAEWTTPSGTRHAVPVIEGAAEFVPTEAGFHRIGASQGERSVGVNVDWESESGAPAPRNATAAGAEVASTAPSWPTRPWPWLTGFALLLCLVEWWTHHRRLTV
ncbi:MAG: hypothetical protein KC417_16125, partial [Myxococcales bacterium]|nr:hypothetical protein [Myxococcales bacterium]